MERRTLPSGTFSVIATKAANSNSHSDTGLTAGTSYEYRVRATHSSGTNSAYSNTASATTTSITVPGAPTGLSATPGNTQVSLSWTAPASNGGSAITDYIIEYRTGTDAFAVFDDGTSTSTSATVTGLTNGVSYDFRVSAVNSAGTGTASSTASATPATTAHAYQVVTSTNAGSVIFSTPSTLASLNAVSPSSLSTPPPSNIQFPFGLHDWRLTDIDLGSRATLELTYPSAVPAGAQYWKLVGSNWIDATSILGSDDGDNFITLTIVDGGPFDDDGLVNGEISDPGGIGILATSSTTAQQSKGPTPLAKIPPPEIMGIGLYKIKLNSNENQIAERGSYTKNPNTHFERFIPYSKLSDTIDYDNYGIPQNYKKTGQYFYTREYQTYIPTSYGMVNQPIQVQIRIDDEYDITKLRHLSFYTDFRDGVIDKTHSDAYVIVDNNEIEDIFDRNGIFKDVKVNTSIENGELWVILDFVFKKPMEKSGILLETWNEGRKIVTREIADVWEITEDPRFIKADDETVSSKPDVQIMPYSASAVCAKNDSCYSPSTVTILKGDSVTWKNSGFYIHTITSGYPNDPNNLFRAYLNPSESFTTTFDYAGKYPYFCEIHPWMKGIVIVKELDTANQPQSEKSTAGQKLVIKSITTGKSLLIENNDEVYLADRSLAVEISGHVDGVSRDNVDLLIKRPDRSFEKIKVFANEDGDYKIKTQLYEKWQGGTYTIVAQYDKKILATTSFTIMEQTNSK